MTEPLSIQERAAVILQDLPKMCTPRELGERVGVSSQTITRLIVRRGYQILRTPAGWRRIPRSVQVNIAEEFVRQGWNG